MKPKFKRSKDGLAIVDPIEREHYPLRTATSVIPTFCNGEHIPYPVDSAASITTSQVTLPENPTIYVRNPDGELCREVGPGTDIYFPKDEYVLDLSGPLKVYAYVDSAIQVRVGTNQADIAFEKPTRVTIGARSFHRRPAETISTTSDPTDVMQAVSMFGSALKTTTQERAYPTHRGHPPAVELADEVSIPNSLKQPQTGIKIEVPPTLRHVFSVASLAYYLGAKVVPGSKPQLVTDSGFDYSLDNNYGFETTVERVLKKVFFLDCVVQTEGETPSSLYVRQAIESKLEFEMEELYHQPTTKQLERYLETPFDVLEPQLPTQYSEVRLKPTANHIEFLPFVSNDLSIIKSSDEFSGFEPTVQDSTSNENRERMEVNSEPDSTNHVRGIDHRVPEPTIQQYWKNGSDTDVVSTKPLSAFQNGITQSPRDGPLRIEVVCNDPNMGDELVTVHSMYKKKSAVPFDVTVHHDLTTEELQDVFAKESDFLHYIGHIDSDGFRCSDGEVNADALETVRTKAFFLNACRSYEQGLELIEGGAIGGIVTLTEVRNRAAVAAGKTIARLLNSGLPLHATLNVLQKITDGDRQYHLLGDGLLSVSHFEVGPPITISIAKNGPGYEVTITSYTDSRYRPGGVFTPYISNSDSYYLVPERVSFHDVPKPDLVEFLNMDEIPVLLEGELRWSNEIKTSEL